MSLEQELLTYIVKEHLPGEAPGALNAGDDLIGSGILDSLALVKLVGHLEQRYGVLVGPEELSADNFASVVALARFVDGKRAGS